MHAKLVIAFYVWGLVSRKPLAIRYQMNAKTISAAALLIVASGSTSTAQQKPASPLAPPSFPSAATSQARQFRLGELTITGNTHTKLFVILRMIPLSPGDIFNQ